MAVHILDAMAREGFEELVAIHDRRSGLLAFLGVHDTIQGPAFGGVRRWVYRDERAALLDCLRLSRAMTHKCALAELPAGGGKIVIMDRPEMDVAGAYKHIGRVLEARGGTFYAGPDVGTGEEHLGWMTENTQFVTQPGDAGPGMLPECTAEGVFRGMEAALEQLDGEVDWPAQTVVIQGLGAVGRLLARRIVERGAKVKASELDPERAIRVGEELGIEILSEPSELEESCDILAPCALGGILHDLTLSRLQCRIVAGAANNILARPLHGDQLAEQGILYVPDFVLNCGALIRGTYYHLQGHREPVEAIGDRVAVIARSILSRAAAEGLSPTRVAVREAEERILRWRDSEAERSGVRSIPLPTDIAESNTPTRTS